MSAPALAAQLAEESRAAQRQYVLANTRARWTLLGLGVALLAAVRLARLVPVSWWLIVGFAAVFAGPTIGLIGIPADPRSARGKPPATMATAAGVVASGLSALGRPGSCGGPPVLSAAFGLPGCP